jgi:hypothetical protein
VTPRPARPTYLPTPPPIPEYPPAEVSTTPAPTSPAPDVNPNAKTVTYEAFGIHIWASYQKVKPKFRAVEKAVDSGRLGQLANAVGGAKGWADTEQKWVRNHAPTACYSAYYEVWRTAIDMIQDGFADIDDGLKPLNEAKVLRGSQTLQQAGRLLVDTDATPYQHCLTNDPGINTAT